METNLLDRMLHAYRDAKTAVTVTLRNKTRVSGTIAAYDGYVILVDGPNRQIVYRHAVSSLAPFRQEARRQEGATVEKPRPKPAPKPRPTHPPAAPVVSAANLSINSGMKDGLLKWMQGQKAAK